MKTSPAFGQKVKDTTIDAALLSGPGKDIVIKTMQQLSSIKGMRDIFGPFDADNITKRWADYQRFDWSIRQLPAINIFESQVEDKTSDQAYLNGTISFQIFWPPSFRRSDLARVPASFKGVLENFFSSQYVTDMLDEIYFHERPMKVAGLNEYGKTMTWTPSTEGLVESELVPVTILDVRYRIDLRSWYRALEFMNRTKANPFEETLADLAELVGKYQGVEDDEAAIVDIELPDEIPVTNP